MAANSLTTTYSDLRVEVGRELGWGRSYSDWTSENKSDFGYIAKEGYRQFLYPDPLPKENKSHNWSFLYPLGTLQIAEGYSTGTIEVTVNVSGESVAVSGTGTTWSDISHWAEDGEIWYTTDAGEKARIGIDSLTVALPDTALNANYDDAAAMDESADVAAGAS